MFYCIILLPILHPTMRSPSYSYPVTSSDLQYSDVSNKKQYDPFEMMNIARILIIEKNLKKATEIRESLKII